MATILFQAAGAALGSAFGPFGAILGRAVGGLAGAAVDRALIGGGSSTVTGPRLATARIPGADEGTPITRLYGTARIGGTLIWATRFEEEVTSERQGGKATSGKRVETFSYYANLAVGLCEGEIALVRRVWADGRELDLTTIEMRVYRGTEDQLADPLIEAKQGAGQAPAYRGLAYVVFERLPINDFGNRIPLLQFEVVRPVGRLERQVRAVTLIPGSTEHGYATEQVTEQTGEGSARILNRNILTAATDWQASLDELQALCPNLDAVALVVSWFGTDLRAGHCRIVPGVEVSGRDGESQPWQVAGIERGDAYLVSRNGTGPAYGGTPGDASVLQAIADLKARGIKIFLYPFVMMDVPAGNTLPDPYGGAVQPPYPWRGRITCHPAPGNAGSTDRSAAAAAEVDLFCNGAEGYRRLVLHYAALAAEAGGVDGFIIGSELRGLTRVRGPGDGFPFVAELVRLASDLRALLGPATRLTYGADWSEYFGYQPQDGSGDVYFNLDPLWASPAIDAVGIDNYMPLSDWRDEDLADANPDGARLAEDPVALMAAVSRGEGYDWYYASDADRAARNRSPITDGLAGKPWVFRYKDIRNWWSNQHFDRVGGSERPVPTGWVPGSKPIWFTELGCPAIDKGANQPNVFVDPKSSESARPYFSSGGRSDSMQRRFLEAHLDWWNGSAAPAGMLDTDRIFLWTWDSRPYPVFPNDLSIWSDGENWRTGHWLTGRLGATTLADAIAAILTEHGFVEYDVSEVAGDLIGYIKADVGSARALIEPLVQTFLLDVIEDRGTLRFRSRTKVSLPAREIDVLAERPDEPAWSETRGHDSDFAAEAVASFSNPVLDYEQASVRSRRIAGASQRIIQADIAGVLYEDAAQGTAEALLRDNHVSRRTLTLPLSPTDVSVMPGDAIRVVDGPDGIYVVTRIEDGDVRRIEARRHEPAAPIPASAGASERTSAATASSSFSPLVQFLDLPRFDGSDAAGFARIAAFCRPFRRMLLSSSTSGEGFRTRAAIERPATIGRLAAAISACIVGRFDRSGEIVVDLVSGSLSSAAEAAVLGGNNRLALLSGNGSFEIIGFCNATEIAPNRWRVSRLLRGLAGTEDAMAAGATHGAPVVFLDAAVVPIGLLPEERSMALNWLVEPLGSAAGRAGPYVLAGGVRAETPLAPVHLRARRGPDQVRFTWMRRGRVGADDWAATDIPLDEPEERYALEIMAAATTLRRVEVTAPAFDYPQALELADFGTLQAGFQIRLRQLGRAVPLGIAAMADLVPKHEGDA
ncbi:glycoside hydrolase/phage tail family protein [Rhizobium sp. 0TCS1.26]|uniref:baseplate multidomain protein megatron n=1 Tax=Rhizobium sp. 0TCS1.26 TaxID=3142623 RepID=UPI003D2A0192